MDIFTVDKFLGLNEQADGKTELKMGEASECTNWYITDGFNLKGRPGIKYAGDKLEIGAVRATWAGFVGAKEYLAVVSFSQGIDRIAMFRRKAGTVVQEYRADGLLEEPYKEPYCKIFDYGGQLYVMGTKKTLVWNGTEFVPAEPYVPTVIVGAAPAGGGTILDSANLLSPTRKMEFSGDGEATVYTLPKEAFEKVTATVDGVSTAATWDQAQHQLTFTQPPAKGVGNVEVRYSIKQEDAQAARMQVARMLLTESYNGATDSRLFFGGDGNKLLYTSPTSDGGLDRLYVPAMNEMVIGPSSAPVTGMVRHYGQLLVFKPDGAYSVYYQPTTLADGNVIAGFYMRTVSRDIGSDLFGQVQTVGNFPRTIAKGGIYEWRIAASINQEERYAHRVSGKVERTLRKADMSRVVTVDDNETKTYYVFLNDAEGTVLVNRYALTKEGIWTVYKSKRFRDVSAAYMIGDILTFITKNEMCELDDGYDGDEVTLPDRGKYPIHSVWKSGYMAFGKDFLRKYSSKIYVSVKPEAHSSVYVTAKTDRREAYREKLVESNLFDWGDIDWSNFTWNTNSTPKIRRIKLKVKKFVYYQLIFEMRDRGANATILGYDQQVRFGSYAK